MTSFSHHLRPFVGVAIGAVTGLAGAGYLVGAGTLVVLTAPVPVLRRRVAARVRAGGRRLALLDRGRVNRLLGTTVDGGVQDARALAYLALRVPVGLFAATLYLLLLWGAGTVAAILSGWLAGRPVDGIEPSPLIIGYLFCAGAVLLFLNLQGILAVGRMDCSLVRRLLVPDRHAAYERRIAELSRARAAVVSAVDAERRRIERDLHDGIQQRLVAVGMLLGRARRLQGDADRARLDELLRQAHDEAADALVELREVAWRVFPAALDTGGLPAALETVADRSPIPVTLDVDAGPQLVTAVETVAYFVVCEAVTNAVKHAAAGRIDVRVRRTDENLSVWVRDDGGGGADPSGGGLTGLARRVAALDGSFSVDSPPGGPTIVEAVLPCP